MTQQHTFPRTRSFAPATGWVIRVCRTYRVDPEKPWPYVSPVLGFAVVDFQDADGIGSKVDAVFIDHEGTITTQLEASAYAFVEGASIEFELTRETLPLSGPVPA